MSLFPSILVPLDGSRTATRGLRCAVWLGTRLGGRVHVLSATPRERPARDELVRLNVPEAHWPFITLHQAAAYPEDAILAAVARYGVSLIVMTASGEGPEELSAPGPIVGHVTRGVIERAPCPVLLLPPAYRENLPWTRILVPLSGEVNADDALVLAVRLATALGIDVQVAHVEEADTAEGLGGRARYADAVHHEYSGQLEEFVGRALPETAREECRCVTGIALCHGDVAGELLHLIERRQISLLAMGWRGRFMTGRARVLKRLLQVLTQPILLVKPGRPAEFRLRVGHEIE